MNWPDSTLRPIKKHKSNRHYGHDLVKENVNTVPNPDSVIFSQIHVMVIAPNTK